MSQAGKAGVDLSAAPEIPLGIQLGGTVTNPIGQGRRRESRLVGDAGREGGGAGGRRRRCSAEATRLVQEAEQQAAAIRQQAETLAAR